MIKPSEIPLKELEDKGLCLECGSIIHATSHYCDSCKSRVSVAVPIEPIKQHIADLLNGILEGIEKEIMIDSGANDTKSVYAGRIGGLEKAKQIIEGRIKDV